MCKYLPKDTETATATATNELTLNMIDRSFASTTSQREGLESLGSGDELVEVIGNYVAQHNEDSDAACGPNRPCISPRRSEAKGQPSR